jgi:hypothetical protein
MQRLISNADRDALVTRLRSLRADTPARWGRMNCSQMVCHLADTFRWALGERSAGERRDNLLSRTLIKWVALGTEMPWPKGYQTGKPFAQVEGGGTPPAEFERDRDDLVALMDRWMAIPAGAARPPHPTFGPLTLAEWRRWAWAHMDHHFRQFGA